MSVHCSLYRTTHIHKLILSHEHSLTHFQGVKRIVFTNFVKQSWQEWRQESRNLIISSHGYLYPGYIYSVELRGRDAVARACLISMTYVARIMTFWTVCPVKCESALKLQIFESPLKSPFLKFPFLSRSQCYCIISLASQETTEDASRDHLRHVFYFSCLMT